MHLKQETGIFGHMKSKLIALAVLALPLGCTTLPERAPSNSDHSDLVQVMVLGTYHMDSPGADLVNLEAEDVLAPARQSELKDLVRRLADFEPTAIMVEAESTRSDLRDTGYLYFTPEKLQTVRNEITQIAYRLAHARGIDRVYGVDVRKGEIDFFPFDKVRAFESVKEIELTGLLIAQVQVDVARFAAARTSETISQLLTRQNQPAQIKAMHNQFHYGVLELADAESQPGAMLNDGWYARNALTFGKIAASTAPGDRVIVLFGSGHAYWLLHFAENTPGCSLVEPIPYLARAETP